MIIALSILLTVTAIVYILYIRETDLPAPEPASPTRHLEERKAAIYENLRDLHFEFRVGKLSEQDYQQTKLELQQELAAVTKQIETILGGKAASATAPAPAVEAPSEQAGKAQLGRFVCPRCQAAFEQPMNFCGKCGSPMKEAGR